MWIWNKYRKPFTWNHMLTRRDEHRLLLLRNEILHSRSKFNPYPKLDESIIYAIFLFDGKCTNLLTSGLFTRSRSLIHRGDLTETQTSYLISSEPQFIPGILIRMPIHRSKNLRIHPRSWSRGNLGNLVFRSGKKTDIKNIYSRNYSENPIFDPGRYFMDPEKKLWSSGWLR